ncbi:MAG: FHA domain-containing protein [Gammaproteobacteria bacterium]|nr:FHA domain-containing protein [Gammaproteobacteria bacterium]
MSHETITCAVMFADVAGSTRLYENYGDEKANSAISACVEKMAEITSQYKGIVIKTIGDEIMCRFDTASQAVNAACGIHEAMELPSGPDGIKLSVRIGLHAGPAILEDDDVFGDAVNVAARMAGIAKARQIITTEETFKQLSPALQDMGREFDKTSVRGKQDLITIYDIMWDEEDDVTTMSFSPAAQQGDNELILTYQDQVFTIQSNDGSFTVGRSPASNLPIATQFGSRAHAKIGYSRGKFVLSDQSTNGTYVKLVDGSEVYLRRKEMPLSSEGSFALGEHVNEDALHIVRYSVK